MIKAEVLNQKIRLDAEVVAANSVNFLEIKFILDNSWNGTVKTAVFENEGFKTAVIMEEGNPLYLGDNTCLVPFEVIKSPSFSVSISGISNDKVITTIPSKIKVYDSGDINGEAPQEYSPSQYEQLVSIYEQSRDIAKSVRDDADKGLFKGEKGEQGIPGSVTPEFIALADGVKSDRILAQNASDTAVNIANRILNNEAYYLNIIKNEQNGKIIRAKDISPIKQNITAKLSSNNVADFSEIQLIKCGKNIFDFGNLSDYITNFLTLSVGTNGLTATKTQPSSISYILNTKKMPIGTFCLKGNSSSDVTFLIRLFDKNGNILTTNETNIPNCKYNTFYQAWIANTKNNALVSIPKEASYWHLGLVFEVDKTISNIQISCGEADEEFEPFNATYFNPSIDGTIEIETSDKTDLTIFTNNPDIDITLNYNADIKLYIDNKLA